MKQSQKELDPNRYYEITKVEEDGVWYAPLDAHDSVIGAIVRPMKKGNSSLSFNNYLIIAQSVSGYLTLGERRAMSKLTLRPLTMKEQEKVDETRRNAA